MKSSPFIAVERLYGPKAFAKIQSAHIMIIGLGGVGSWTAETLARSGVGALTLVDLDEVCLTNINRQVHALTTTIGQNKADLLKQRLLTINPNLKAFAVEDFYTKENSGQFFETRPDFIVDCIDSLESKCHLISECRKNQTPLVVTGASAGKLNPFKVETSDLNLSYNDPLLFRVRKKLKKDYGFPRFSKKKFKIPCVFSTELPKDRPKSSSAISCEKIGSVAHLTASFGMMASYLALESVANEAH